MLFRLLTVIWLCWTWTDDARGAKDCENLAPLYTDADLEAPMRFFFSGTGCSGNAVSDPYLAVGKITSDTPAAFAVFAKNNPPSVPIQFVSPGGNLFGALKLGEMIRAGGYDTSLGEMCASACAYAVLGGNRRYIAIQESGSDGDYNGRIVGATGAKLGVHQFYQNEALTEPEKKAFTAVDRSADQIITGVLLEYTQRMGVDTSLVATAAGTLPQQMRWVSPVEMVAWNVDNVQRRYSPLLFHSFGPSGAYVEVKSMKGPDTSFLRIFCQKAVKEPLFAFELEFVTDQLPPSGAGTNWVESAKNQFSVLLGNLTLEGRFQNGKAQNYTFQIQQMFGVLKGNKSVLVRAVLRPAALTRQEAERLVNIALVDNGDLARGYWSIQDVLKFKLSGDQKLIQLAMRNCTD